MFFGEDEAKIYENGVRQLRRTWRSAFNSVCLAVASDGVGCVCEVVIMPTLNPPEDCLRISFVSDNWWSAAWYFFACSLVLKKRLQARSTSSCFLQHRRRNEFFRRRALRDLRRYSYTD